MSEQQNRIRHAYSRVPYPGVADAKAHIRYLEALATLFGIQPADIAGCRVLELGCASGTNLIPQAFDYPHARFVGVDFSVDRIAEARSVVDELSLDNIRLEHANITDVDSSWGLFDYILCPGVFSWVAPEVQDKILAICKENLAPHGVAVVSYNANPGWLFQSVARDLMRYHVAPFEDPTRQISEARSVLEFVADNCPKDTVQAQLFRNEREYLRTVRDNYLYHDYLVEDNRPLYFHEFVRRAESHGLQFVSDADLGRMSGSFLSHEVQRVLVNSPLVQQCQLLDFLHNAAFHKTLLCHEQITLRRQWEPAAIEPFHLALADKPKPNEFDVSSREPIGIEFPQGKLTTSEPLGKAAIKYLIDLWPQTIRLEALYAAVLPQLPEPVSSDDGAAGLDALGGAMMAAFSAGLLRIYLHPPEFCTSISDTPQATELARVLAARKGVLTNQMHDNTLFDDLQFYVLSRLDGCNNRTRLLGELRQAVDSGELKTDKDQQSLPETLDTTLAFFARNALLIA
jgi:SAM-dependent methyltransferase/methyltransferase-like protein